MQQSPPAYSDAGRDKVLPRGGRTATPVASSPPHRRPASRPAGRYAVPPAGPAPQSDYAHPFRQSQPSTEPPCRAAPPRIQRLPPGFLKVAWRLSRAVLTTQCLRLLRLNRSHPASPPTCTSRSPQAIRLAPAGFGSTSRFRFAAIKSQEINSKSKSQTEPNQLRDVLLSMGSHGNQPRKRAQLAPEIRCRSLS